MTNLQDKPIVIGSPVEIERAVNDIRIMLANLSWIDKAYFIVQKFYRKQENKRYYFPETYAPENPGSKNYHRVTPDASFNGTLFFVVSPGTNKDNDFMTYNVGIIFSANLEKIDASRLDEGLFTQNLISEAKKLIELKKWNYESFTYEIKSETRDLREVFREFSLDEAEQYNRAPMQCFRINLTLTVENDC